MTNRVLAIDPSGTGTTGIFFKDGDQEQFNQFTDKDWTKHYQFIYSLVKKYHPDTLLFENTNWISLRGKDMTFLLKLLGALESLVYLNQVATVALVPVNQVKGLRKKLLKGEKKINELEYQNGKGWIWKGKRISLHCLDAYLIYWLEFEKEKSSLLGQKSSKIKQILWQN
jgi:hypothetical protein